MFFPCYTVWLSRCLLFQNEQKTAKAEEEIAKLKARVRFLCIEVEKKKRKKTYEHERIWRSKAWFIIHT